VSSEQTFDGLRIQKNYSTIAFVSGDIRKDQRTIELTEGDVLTLTYLKDYRTSKGTDTASFSFSCACEKEPDCVNAVVCSACGEVVKDALGHSWNAATYTAPKTCDLCGATEGEPLTPETPDEPFMLPTVELVNGKIVVSGTYDYIRLVYVGEENNVFDSWANMLKAGKTHAENGTDGYIRVDKENMPTELTLSGNYAVRVIYTDENGKAAGVNYAFTNP
jgi:hypothetical protein